MYAGSRAGSRAKRVADDEMPDSAYTLRGREGGSNDEDELTFCIVGP